MTGIEVTPTAFKSRLSAEQRASVDRAQADGLGVALFVADHRGGPRHFLTYGRRGADIDGRYPPRMYGGAELAEFVPPPHVPQAMVSPLKNWEQPVQIARPRVAPGHTEYPSVQIEMRTSRHPRGDNDGSYIDAQRLLPGREPAEQQVLPEAPTPPSESERWWRDHLSGR